MHGQMDEWKDRSLDRQRMCLSKTKRLNTYITKGVLFAKLLIR